MSVIIRKLKVVGSMVIGPKVDGLTPTATPLPATATPIPATATPTPTAISCVDIPFNSDGGLVGWSVGGSPTAFSIAPNPDIGTIYPVGSQITFQNGEIRTMVAIDDYSPSYIDLFYDSPISTGTLFPITICEPS